ncbi:hypothetical protein SAMN04489832_5835 [Micromonospora cremea]|uniref:Uncharacterized protein n=1 Tax=Micromonospora cremea TaxID=709881 RepID=A0A1N6ANI5_9ACTN|nr:hypothetical protein SAMN04489832_5835 [Micromonospora cremea]
MLRLGAADVGMTVDTANRLQGRDYGLDRCVVPGEAGRLTVFSLSLPLGA